MKLTLTILLSVLGLSLPAQVAYTRLLIAANMVVPTNAPAQTNSADGLWAWLDASKLTSNHNDSVMIWPDSSGLGNGATNTTGGAQPTFMTNQINGLPALSFDNTDDQLLMGETAELTGLAVHIVCKDEGDTLRFAFRAYDSVGGDDLFLTTYTIYSPAFPHWKLQMNGGADVRNMLGFADGTAWMAAWHVASLLYDGTNSIAFLDGVATQTNANSGSFHFHIPTLGHFDTYPFYGKIAELQIWTNAQPYSACLATNTALKNRYGL
jgi:hypothetical protein